MNAVWVLLAAAGLAILQSLVLGTFNLRSLTYRRYLSRSTAYEGDTIDLVEVIRNNKLLPVPWLRAESRISPSLRFSRQHSAEREISGDQYHKSVFFLPPFRQITRRHEIKCLKRGFYDIGSVALTAGDMLGMSSRTRQQKHDCRLEVYPRLLNDEELGFPSSRWQGELAVRRFIQPDPFLVAGIRAYMQGDPQRDIHWRATARTGSLQVKVRDYTADPRVMIVLNVQSIENQWGELMEYEQETVEQGIRVAASLCLRALHVGSEAGFAANGCYAGEKGSGHTVLVPAGRSSDQAEALLSAMARLTIHYEVSFQTFLDGLELYGADILILSAYDSDGIRRRMREMQLMGNSVSLQLLQQHNTPQEGSVGA